MRVPRTRAATAGRRPRSGEGCRRRSRRQRAVGRELAHVRLRRVQAPRLGERAAVERDHARTARAVVAAGDPQRGSAGEAVRAAVAAVGHHRPVGRVLPHVIELGKRAAVDGRDPGAAAAVIAARDPLGGPAGEAVGAAVVDVGDHRPVSRERPVAVEVGGCLHPGAAVAVVAARDVQRRAADDAVYVRAYGDQAPVGRGRSCRARRQERPADEAEQRQEDVGADPVSGQERNSFRSGAGVSRPGSGDRPRVRSRAASVPLRSSVQ